VQVKDVIRVENTRLFSTGLYLADIVRAADAAARHVGGLTLDKHQLKSVIRSQVRAAQKERPSDQTIAKYFATSSSAREAAERMKKDGYSVHHSTISRRRKRDVDAAECVRTEDSASICRTVASQECDKRIKTEKYRK